MKTEKWKKDLMDEFCVMFERAGEEYPEKLEQFIQNTLEAQEQEWKRRILEWIEKYDDDSLYLKNDLILFINK